MRLALLNVFRFCKYLKVLGHVMVLVVLGLIAVQYYTVIVVTLGPEMSSNDSLKASGTGILAGLYTILVFMILWSYFTTVLTNPGVVPETWHPFTTPSEAEHELQMLTQYGQTRYNTADPRRPRYCRKCSVWKPQRAHHCSVSGRCILKMDHYCIWVVNCIGLLNYKFFLLFLFYALIGCFTSMCILTPSLVDFFADGKSDTSTLVFSAFLLNVAFLLSLFAFFSMHVRLLSINCTSIEMYEKQLMIPWPYDRGAWNNIKDVLGQSFWLALIPIHIESERERLKDSVLAQSLISGLTCTDTNV